MCPNNLLYSRVELAVLAVGAGGVVGCVFLLSILSFVLSPYLEYGLV